MSILQRQVLSELLRVFSMLLTGLTVMLVFVGVVGEATKHGLGPVQVVAIMPYIVPSLLPFTIPACFLLTVCVVYGRMSADQEVTAVKAAGISIWALLWPSFFLGASLSLCTLILTDQFIPWARANIERIVTLAMEDIFLDMLRTNNQVNDVDHGVAITVMRVDGKRLVKPTFRYTPPGGNTVTVQAQEATIRFDMAKQEVLVELEKGYIETAGKTTFWFERETRPFPLPNQIAPAHVRNISIEQIRHEMRDLEKQIGDMEQRRLLTMTFLLTAGELTRLPLHDEAAHKWKLNHNRDRFARLYTEIHSRIALACSCFFFVLVGSPFSILQGKRQFLTNFFLCFVPILVVYYPLILLAMNLGKSEILDPSLGMWIGNAVLFVAGIVILRRVLKN